MYLKILLNTILIITLTAVQLSFVSGLPGILSHLNLVLVIFVFILGLAGLETALGWAMVAGVLLDILTFIPFGAHLVSLPLVILAVNFLLVNFFTNRSLYSFFALTIFATLLYELLLNFINYFYRVLGGGYFKLALDFNFLSLELKQMAVNLMAVFVIFYGINFISKRLKPVFLVKT